MPRTHKLVLDNILAAMRDDAAGFNAQLAAALPFYGVILRKDDAPIALDWNAGSASVGYGAFAQSDIPLSVLAGTLTLQIQPSGSQWTGETRGIKWSGIVGTKLVFTLTYSYREGIENPPEDALVLSIATAIEDAVVEVFHAYRGWSECVVYAKPPDCPEGYLFEPLNDGAQVTIPISVGFKVDAY